MDNKYVIVTFYVSDETLEDEVDEIIGEFYNRESALKYAGDNNIDDFSLWEMIDPSSWKNSKQTGDNNE